MSLLNSLYQGIILAGPTGSGKSSLALELATSLAPSQPAEIINADSMQIYKDLSIITARPTVEDCAAVPHHLYGVAEADHKGSAGWWVEKAEKQIEACQKRHVLPIIVGGTGLYLNTLVNGLSSIPKIESDLRQHVRDLSEQLGNNFYAYVANYDSLVIERLKPKDHHRLQRALEVYLQTGKSIYWWHAHIPAPRYSFLYCLLLPAREQLYQRINDRFDKMIHEGGLEEVRYLQTLSIDDDSPILKAIGVKELTAFLKGEYELPTAVELAKRNSRRYAKRQLTWFRHQVSKKVVLESSELSILRSMISEKVNINGLG